ncbi:MAG: hypothetical protein E6261_04595 [Cutibacterium avidum]|nr:hypothetical protein [Cutibacterium avidum]
MTTDIDLTSGGIRLRTEGLAATMRALSKAGADTADMKTLMHSIGMTVVHAAQPRTPHRRGALARSLRAGHGKTKAVVRAGGRAAKYGPVQHYGWPAHHIRPKPFLINALAATRTQVFHQLDDGIDHILKHNNLK